MNIPTDLTALRRADVDAKQAWVACLLAEVGCEGLLLLEPANFAWMTCGAVAHGLLDPTERPGVYVSPEYRWLLCSNLDTQRLFDEELDGLGFQLKEWPWRWGRDQLLTALQTHRKLACDRAYRKCVSVGDALRQQRRALSACEQMGMFALGRLLAHALEATGRTLERGQSEEEVAGQLAHRLLHRGLYPVVIQVAADGRGRRYRRHGATPTTVQQTCVLQATAMRDGLYASAARCVSFGEPETEFRQEFETACRLGAVYLAHTRSGVPAAEAAAMGRRFLATTEFEHDWRQAPPGLVTGRTPAELPLTSSEPMQTGWAVAWLASVGAVAGGDTCLIEPEGARIATPCEDWPVRRVKIQGAFFDRPDLLIRNEK